MTPLEAKAEMATHKWPFGQLKFIPRSNHKGHLILVAQVQDANRVLMPALTIQIEVKAPIVTARCYYTFSLMKRVGPMRIRVYQLEVVPANKISHRGEPDISGPHEHFGDEAEPSKIADPAVNCDDWGACLNWFSDRITLRNFQVASPC